MKYITDFHIHSRFSRACSKDLNLSNIAEWCQKKGINIVATSDFTHPEWFKELEAELQESEPGLYKLKNSENSTRFICGTELAVIYKQGDKVRRVHVLVFAPSLEVVAKFNKTLEDRGVNLRADGRPIMGLHCDELVRIAKGVDQRMEVIPAHAWTPHFGVFGSLSGFDSLEEAFGDQAEHIFAIETGLSSDPPMNWQIRDLDKIALISNSDAHSLRKLGREANIFEVSPEELSYNIIFEILKNKNSKQFIQTIEFYPEEGKYHLDGHRNCNFSCLPEETNRQKDVCPKCGKKLLRGTLSRVSELSLRKLGQKPDKAIPFEYIIPLEEIIAETLGYGTQSKKVQETYDSMVAQETEFNLLLNTPINQIAKISNQFIAESINRLRSGDVNLTPGYDGVFGKIKIYTAKERTSLGLKPVK
ncbi:MAG: endonuclease Q family protein [Candidatus Doudnabacteria bacterium]